MGYSPWGHKESDTTERLSTPSRDIGPRLLYPWNSLGKNTGVGCHFLFQVIFPTQGSNPGLVHCRQILCHLSHQGSPNTEFSWTSAEKQKLKMHPQEAGSQKRVRCLGTSKTLSSYLPYYQIPLKIRMWRLLQLNVGKVYISQGVRLLRYIWSNHDLVTKSEK